LLRSLSEEIRQEKSVTNVSEQRSDHYNGCQTHKKESDALMPLDAILERLSDRKATSNGWQAKCPAHDDRKASLCIHQEQDGKVLLKCQAGCETKDILAALGLTWNDLFSEGSHPPRSQQGHKKKRHRNFAADRRVVATYDYVNEDGELLYQIQRTDTKEFIQRRDRKSVV
jgi:hypothetical protein